MPHIARWLINGQVAPSVNQITDMIPKSWLINWYRKVGFEEADKISKTSREHGTNIHDIFDRYWQGNLDLSSLSELEGMFLKSIQSWALKNDVKVFKSEPHLESKTHIFHGSPDLIASVHLKNTIIDYKIKDKYPDYKTILNETAYALMCHEMSGTYIEDILILNFNKETGELSQEISLPIIPQYRDDFLDLRKAYDVKMRADAWDNEYIRSKFRKSK